MRGWKRCFSLVMVGLFLFPNLVHGITFTPEVVKRSKKEQQIRKFFGVCPPFYLSLIHI